MSHPLILDSAALTELSGPIRAGRRSRLWSLVTEMWLIDREVLTPAVVCAEVCRGRDRTRAVESLLARHDAANGRRSGIRVVDTTFRLARIVGAVLSESGSGTEDLVDAHLIALCLPTGGGLIVTSDPNDMLRLAAPFPGLRVVTRPVR